MKSKVYFLIALLILAVSFVSCRQASALITPLAVRPNGTNRLKLIQDSGSQFFASAGRPRNGRIAFSAPAPGGEQVFSIDAQGGSRLQLTTEGSTNKYPAWSSDGTKIVFSSNRTGVFELWTMRADGGVQTQIRTELPGEKIIPQLSPDGTTIVFAYLDPAIGHPEVWSISANGGNARKLTTTPKAATGPTWSLLPHFSPDGRRIVYASTKSGSSQIWIMNADGSGQTQVTSGLGAQFPDANAPKWSSDGSTIVFWSGFETQYGEVWTMRADGTDARQLTDQPGTISSDNPAWSPDGTKILFDTNRQGSPQIWMMNADGSDQHLLVDIGIGNTQFSWQPLSETEAAGRRMAFVNRQDGVNHIYLMDIDSEGTGRNVARLTGSPESENYPSWSPDGKKLLYQRALDGSAIYVINADGSNARRLSPTPGFDVSPDWSPGGSQIIYARVLGLIVPGQIPQTEIHVMNADGSADRVILPSSAFSVEPRWSVNNQIVFMSLKNGGQHIFTMNSDGSNIKQLTRQGNNGDPAWSPDGSKISFGSNREGGGKLNVYVMNADGSNVQQLTHFDVPFESGDTNWSADGKKIAFEYDVGGKSQSDPSAFAEVWTMSVDGSGQTSTQQRCSGVGCAPRWRALPWTEVAIASIQILSKGKPVDHLVAGAKAKKYQINLTGGGFTSESKTFIDGAEAETSLTSNTELTVKLPFKRVPDVGALTVIVRTGAQVSNSLTIQVRRE